MARKSPPSESPESGAEQDHRDDGANPAAADEELESLLGVRFRKGLPTINRFWQTTVHHVPTFANTLGIEGKYMQELPGSYYNRSSHNVYFDWLFLISDSPITTEQLKPSKGKSARVRLGHGEFVTYLRRHQLGGRLWWYLVAVCEKWGWDCDVQQVVIVTSEYPPPRLEDALFIGPTVNARRMISGCVHPSDCDPDLLDPDERDSPAGRVLVMQMRGGPTEAQADRVIETLQSMTDPDEYWDYLYYILLAIESYGNIYSALRSKLEAIMTDQVEYVIKSPPSGDLPELPAYTPEQHEGFVRWLKRLFPAEQILSAAKDLPQMRESVEGWVDGLKIVLAHKAIELTPAEIEELSTRSLEELPSFASTGKVTSRDEFLELAKLNGHAPPGANGADSDG